MTITIQNLEQLLAQSAATEEFKTAVGALEGGKNSPIIGFSRGCPPVKVLRVISKLLEDQPGLAVRNVQVEADSGCSDFVGTLTVNDGEYVFDFVWDCKWRAQQEGWKDWFGEPDQIRAAREFGYQCFETFKQR
ncbi:MAG: hypothetical protein K1X53_08540 [Candidatus Sumerlaeaceae bacterium]|nr:hypothetical protein [Candidatus Sumerlaeaceae bacterium]